MKRGFQLMEPERVQRIAGMGGRAAHASGNAHEFSKEEARAAALKSWEKRRAKLESKVVE